MQKHLKITESRVRRTLERIRPLVYRDAVPLRVSAWTVGGALLIIAGSLVAVRGKATPAPQTEAAA